MALLEKTAHPKALLSKPTITIPSYLILLISLLVQSCTSAEKPPKLQIVKHGNTYVEVIRPDSLGNFFEFYNQLSPYQQKRLIVNSLSCRGDTTLADIWNSVAPEEKHTNKTEQIPYFIAENGSAYIKGLRSNYDHKEIQISNDVRKLIDQIIQLAEAEEPLSPDQIKFLDSLHTNGLKPDNKKGLVSVYELLVATGERTPTRIFTSITEPKKPTVADLSKSRYWPQFEAILTDKNGKPLGYNSQEETVYFKTQTNLHLRQKKPEKR